MALENRTFAIYRNWSNYLWIILWKSIQLFINNYYSMLKSNACIGFKFLKYFINVVSTNIKIVFIIDFYNIYRSVINYSYFIVVFWENEFWIKIFLRTLFYNIVVLKESKAGDNVGFRLNIEYSQNLFSEN